MVDLAFPFAYERYIVTPTFSGLSQALVWTRRASREIEA